MSIRDRCCIILSGIIARIIYSQYADLCSVAAGLQLVVQINDGLGSCLLYTSMANGTPDAKAAADRIIGDVREDGLADLIDELWFDGTRAEPSGRDLGSPWDKIESAGGQ